jgi:drug/metabolite transporter (DMT)-like permease
MMLAAAFLWGISFVTQRLAALAMNGMPFTFNAARYLIGAVFLAPFVMRAGALRSRATWIGGGAAGCAMIAGSTLQQAAMNAVSAGTAGFITSTYVVWVPLLGLIWGQRVGVRVWIGVALAVAGLWLLCGGGDFALSRAEFMLLGCAFAWGFHVQIIGWAATRGDVFGIAFVQFLVTAVASSAGALAFEPLSVEVVIGAAGPILFAGVFSIAVAFTLQIVGQSAAPPAHAAIIMSLESVFAELAGSVWMNEGFGARKWFGGLLILGGALLATVIGPRQHPREDPRPREAEAD